MKDPLKYYGNNTCSTRTLLRCCLEADVRHFVFSSTAAVYGMPADGVAAEDTPTAPINPYGTSKLMSEWMLARRRARLAPDAMWRCATSTWRAPIPAAASARRPRMRRCSSRSPARWRSASARTSRSTAPTIRRRTAPASVTTSTSRTWRPLIWTPSPTCAPAAPRPTLNVGYGHGYSVREVLASVERIAGRRLKVREEPRRAGRSRRRWWHGPTASAQMLGWRPRLDDLDTIVRTALQLGSSACCASRGRRFPATRRNLIRLGSAPGRMALHAVGASQVIEWTDAPRPGADRRAAAGRHPDRRAADPRPGRHRPEDRGPGRHRGAGEPGAVCADRLARAHRAPLRRAHRSQAARRVPRPGRAPQRHARATAQPLQRQHARDPRGARPAAADHPQHRAARPAQYHGGGRLGPGGALRAAVRARRARRRSRATPRSTPRSRRSRSARCRHASACCGRPPCWCRSRWSRSSC